MMLFYAYAKDEEAAAEIEDNFALHISIVASQILQREIDVVLVYPSGARETGAPIQV